METRKDNPSARAAAGALRAGRPTEAETLALNALAQHPGEPVASEVMGLVRMAEGRFDDAITHLKAGWAAAPGRAELPNLIGIAFAEQGHFKTAFGYFQQAAQAAPDAPFMWENLGKMAFKLRRWSHAREAFMRCTALDEDNVEAAAGLARLALIDGQNDEALTRATAVLGRHPDHILSRQVAAEAALNLGQLGAATTSAQKIITDPNATQEASVLAHGVAADAADGEGRYAEAFDHYTAMNQAMAQVHARGMERAKATASFEKLGPVAAQLPELAKRSAGWPRQSDRPAPIFFIGFPRCGMSNLDRMLLKHPMVIDGAKRPNAPLWVDILWGDETPNRLAALNRDETDKLRRQYWEMVEKGGIDVPPDHLLYECKPYFSQHIWLFAAAFPDAKFVFAHRDPRDVILSCFRHRFPATRAMYEFLDLESTAHYYDLAMEVAWGTWQHLKPPVHHVRYDRLVSDPEGAARDVVAFLGLPWDDHVLEGALPPSAAHSEWRNYEDQLAPVRAIADKWAARFGYD